MRPGMTKRKKLKKPSKKRLKNTQNAISHHTTTKKPIPSPSQGPITTAAVPHRQTFPIFDSLSTLQPMNQHQHHSNSNTNTNHLSSTSSPNHSHSRSAPHHPHLLQRPHPQSAHPRDRHSDPLDARALDPLLNRRDHQSTSSQNPSRTQRSIQDVPHSIRPQPGRSPPLRKIPSASILDSEPKIMSPLPPSTSKHATNQQHQLHAQGTGHQLQSGMGMAMTTSMTNSNSNNNPSSQRDSLVEPVPREMSLSHSPSLSYNSNRGTSPIPPPMSSCSPNPNSSSFIANPSPLPPNTPPHPDCHDPAQLQLRSPATTNSHSNPTSLTTPSPPSNNQAQQQQQQQQQQLPQHHQPQLSDSVSMPSPQIQPPRPTPPAQRQQNGATSQSRTGSRRSSRNNLPQQIIIIHKKKKRRTPSPHSRSHSRSQSRSRSKSRSPSGSNNNGPLQNKSIVKPQTADKAIAVMMSAMSSTATPNHSQSHNHNHNLNNHQHQNHKNMMAPTSNMVSAYNTSSDESTGGSTPILSDGDTSSLEVVVEPIQPKHGIIFEDEQNQEAVAKRDTPVPVDHKKSKYDDNLDFAANQGAKLMSQVSESEDAEYDPLD